LLRNGSKYISAATEADATVEELLEKKYSTTEELLKAVFSMQSTLRVYTRDENRTGISDWQLSL
jgi:hypothetical protein